MMYRTTSLSLVLLINACSSTQQLQESPEPAIQLGEAVDEVKEAPSAMYEGATAGRFDNGRMWAFEYPPMEYLKDTYDFQPDEAWFEKAQLGALRLSGCTASFVSPHGLVMTNHHCARGIAARLSQEGEDLLNNGFFASSIEEERYVDDLYADQLIGIEDVTDEVTAALEAAQTDAEIQQALQGVSGAIQQRLLEAAGGGEEIEVQVVPLYSGGRYSAYTFHRYSNVKMVMAPELQLGNFGGEWDNFSYPRYKLDMTFFRVYDGEEPLQVEHYFAWSENGTVPGELVFVVGNPGSTNRLETVAQLEYRRDVSDKTIHSFLDSRLAAVRAEYAASPTPALKAQLLGISNGEKLYRGRVAGLVNSDIMARRFDSERQFQRAIEADSTLRARYGDLIEQIAEVQLEKRAYAGDFAAFIGLSPQSGNTSPLLRRAMLARDLVKMREVGSTDEELNMLKEQMLQIGDPSESRSKQQLTIRMQEFAVNLSDDEAVSAFFAGRSPEQVAADLLAESAFADTARTRVALEDTSLTLDDPALQLVEAFADRRAAFQSGMAGLNAREQELNRQRGRAQFDVYGTSIPPDATFTLRFADGIVDGYPYNGTVAPPYVTFHGIYDHLHSYAGTDIADSWSLPDRWLNPPMTFDRSTPLNLVSTNDIVGGNSGSPLLNKDLEIVGLVFDGNIESTPTAYIFRTETSRTISVDSRAMVEALDEIYDMDRLVLELTEGELVETEEDADAFLPPAGGR